VSSALIRRPTLVGLLAALACAAPAGAQSPSPDGKFEGTIRCDALPRQRPLVTKVTMSVAEGQARYEREILDPAGGMATGIFERGQGPIGGGGEVTLKTHTETSTYSYDAEYRGRIDGSFARFTGTQYWKIKRETGMIPRPCTLELMRTSS
jgi:hypothetical protein